MLCGRDPAGVAVDSCLLSVHEHLVPLPVAITAGMPYSRATIAACEPIPPESTTTAAARWNSDVQVGWCRGRPVRRRCAAPNSPARITRTGPAAVRRSLERRSPTRLSWWQPDPPDWRGEHGYARQLGAPRRAIPRCRADPIGVGGGEVIRVGRASSSSRYRWKTSSAWGRTPASASRRPPRGACDAGSVALGWRGNGCPHETRPRCGLPRLRAAPPHAGEMIVEAVVEQPPLSLGRRLGCARLWLVLDEDLDHAQHRRRVVAPRRCGDHERAQRLPMAEFIQNWRSAWRKPANLASLPSRVTSVGGSSSLNAARTGGSARTWIASSSRARLASRSVRAPAVSSPNWRDAPSSLSRCEQSQQVETRPRQIVHA